MKRGAAIRALLALLAVAGLLTAAGCRADGAAADAAAPEFIAAELLGRPTDRSVALTLVPAGDLLVQVQWGTAPGAYGAETAAAASSAGQPFVAVLDGLNPDTEYFYRVRCRADGEESFSNRDEGRFRTARAAGAAFRFTVQADSHLDENSDLDLYRRTLANVLADAPDFHVDLGDTFMCEKHSQPLTATLQPAPDPATVDARHVYERGNFAVLSRSVPLFLANGNHDGEEGWLADGGAGNLAVWAARARLRYFLNPFPDGFYGGDAQEEPFVGRRASWYSWRWGNALFVVLDPYWNCRRQPSGNGWNLTLGERQYSWLRETLAASRETFKFVFIHSLVGGLDGQMRGGVEAAPFFEWGGRDADGSYAFDRERPGWGEPIRSLLVSRGVTAVFHGHDHLYARQELDGIVYLEVPQPSAKNSASGPALAAAAHYASGTIASSSGHVRVTVSPAAVTLEYVRSWLPGQESAERRNGQVEDSWTVFAAGGGG